VFVDVPPGNIQRRDLAAAAIGPGLPTGEALVDHGAPIRPLS